MTKKELIEKATSLGIALTGNETVPVLKDLVKNATAGPSQTAMDKRGHEVRKYQDENGAWLVERNNNGSVHPEPCADEAAATALFTSYVEAE